MNDHFRQIAAAFKDQNGMWFGVLLAVALGIFLYSQYFIAGTEGGGGEAAVSSSQNFRIEGATTEIRPATETITIEKRPGE